MCALLFLLSFPCFHRMRISDLVELCKAYVCLVVEGVFAGVLNVTRAYFRKLRWKLASLTAACYPYFELEVRMIIVICSTINWNSCL